MNKAHRWVQLIEKSKGRKSRSTVPLLKIFLLVPTYGILYIYFVTYKFTFCSYLHYMAHLLKSSAFPMYLLTDLLTDLLLGVTS
jgi:hypothetical protein